MKRTSLVPTLILSAGLMLQGAAHAQSFYEALRSALKEVADAKDSSRNNSETTSQQDASCFRAGAGGSGSRIIARPSVSDVQQVDFSKTPTIEEFCQDFRNANPQDARCYKECENQFRDDFALLKSRAEQQDELRQANQLEKARKAEYEKQQEATLESDLRSGRVKPANFKQAGIAYGAEVGIDLASAPKIRPDGKMYMLPGKIAIAGDSPEFLAQISLGDQADMLIRMTGRSSEIDGRYFSVKIPKALQAYYFDKAKINGGFDLVGRYVSNSKYKTVAGQEKSAPVFEAVYFVMR